MTYGGYVKFLAPAVGSVLPFVVVVGTGSIVELDNAAACEDDAAVADTASVALLMLKPSGKRKSNVSGSPGSRKGGWTGFMSSFSSPHDPTQNEEASLRSIQMPSKGVSLCQLTMLFVHHCCDVGMSQSAQTENPGLTIERFEA